MFCKRLFERKQEGSSVKLARYMFETVRENVGESDVDESFITSDHFTNPRFFFFFSKVSYEDRKWCVRENVIFERFKNAQF